MDTGKIINEELMAKTLLYARKRLGNDIDAEELAGDILLSALEGLRRADERPSRAAGHGAHPFCQLHGSRR